MRFIEKLWLSEFAGLKGCKRVAGAQQTTGAQSQIMSTLEGCENLCGR